MEKHLFKILFVFSLLVTLGGCNAHSQNLNADSLALVDGKWQIDTVFSLVKKSIHFQHKELFSSNQFISIIEVPTQSPYHLEFGYRGERTLTSEIALDHHAVAAINGSFFDMKEHYPVCYLRINGKNLGENVPQASDSVHRKYYQYGTLVLKHGKPQILKADSNRLWEDRLNYDNIMTAGPLLMLHNQAEPQITSKEFVSNRHNRTAIGLKPDGTIVLFVVDGRTKKSEGMSLMELTKALHYLGCEDILNLDGGGSTTMVMRKGLGMELLNHPSDNGKYDFGGERTVSNVVMVVKNKHHIVESKNRRGSRGVSNAMRSSDGKITIQTSKNN